MALLAQLALIFGFCLAGEVVARLLPFTLPASVIGLVLLLTALKSGLLKLRQIENAAGFLTANMAFFFLPSAVNILSQYHLIRGALGRLLLICIISTAFVFCAAYGAARLVSIMQAKRRAR